MLDLDGQIEKPVDTSLTSDAPAALVERLHTREAERDGLREQLGGLDEDREPVVLHPAAADKYRAIIRELRMHLEGIREARPVARFIRRCAA